MQSTTIHMIQSMSTGLMPCFEQIYKIEVVSPPFSGGAFGDVFDCASIDDKPPSLPLVVKIFKPDPDENHLRGYKTIRKLQGRVRARTKELLTVPGLYALPQFSFMGKCQNKIVYGYVAHKLDPEHFETLEDILQNRFRDFRQLSFKKKLRMALNLTECFDRLRDLNYIHADINPHNIFVNLEDTFRTQKRHLVLIDYDSGVVVDQPTDTPTTYGKKNEWLAPEVYEQESNLVNGKSNVTVDLFTDIWAVAVGVHYVLFSRFPFFFLKVAGPQELRDYLQRYRWPAVDKNYPNFNPTQARVYDDYRKRFDRIDNDLKRPFILTFNEGVYNRTRRISYAQWTLLLKRVLERRRSIQYGLSFIVVLLIVVVPFFHEASHISIPHHRTAESDAEYAESHLETASRALARHDWGSAVHALTLAEPWDSARVAQFRRDHLRDLQSARDQAPLSAALAAVRQWEERQDKRISAHTLPRPGDLYQDEVSGMDFVYLKGGCFSMGSATTELGRRGDEGLWGRHAVCLEKGFWIATKEVTNTQYRRIEHNHKSGSYHGLTLDGATQPVVNVSWWDAVQYVEKLNHQAKTLSLSQHYRLPNEAQWEYAARAGTTTSNFWGIDAEQGCHYAQMALDQTGDAKTNRSRHINSKASGCSYGYVVSAPVGSFAPNPWGLYDMLGNVWEWTCSEYQDSYNGSEQMCASGSSTEHRVLRGGSWHDPLASSRVADRDSEPPDTRNNYLGLRLLIEF